MPVTARPVTARPVTARPVTATRIGRIAVLAVPWEVRGLADLAGAEAVTGTGHVLRLGPGDALPAHLAAYGSEAFSWERWREAELNDVPPDALPDYLADPRDDSVPTVFTPRPHQVAGAAAALAARDAGLPGFLLADAVGLGKTITAVLAVRAMPDAQLIVIVCPLSVVAHWRRTILGLGHGDRRFLIVNYERAKRLFVPPPAALRVKKTKTKNKHTVGTGRLRLTPDAVIMDESHRARNPTTLTAAACRRLTSAATFSIYASATAGQNPLELSYLARLLAATTGTRLGEVSELDEWAAWCTAQGLGISRGAYGTWLYERSPDVETVIRRMLFEPSVGGAAAGIRRRAMDLQGWPALDTNLVPVSLDAAQRALYLAAWSEYRVRMHLAGRGRDSTARLVQLQRFRQKCSLLRVGQTVDLVQDKLADGHQVVLSVVFTETAQALVDKLGGPEKVALVTGQVTGPAREAERIRFQTGQVKIVVCSVTEGISLHAGERGLPGGAIASTAPRVTIVSDPRWTALELEQISGRAHRDGEYAEMILLVGESTVELEVTQAALYRWKSMRGMQGDPDADLAQAQAVLDRAAAPPPHPGDPPQHRGPRSPESRPVDGDPAEDHEGAGMARAIRLGGTTHSTPRVTPCHVIRPSAETEQ